MTIRDATRRSGPTNTLVRKQATATGRVLTGALRSWLSLKYRRQFGGWFGCPIHLYHHRSVTYGFSSLLFSSLHSALYSSPLSILPILPRVLSYDLSYSGFPFRCPLPPPHYSDINQTPPSALSLLILLLRITTIYHQRTARLPNPIPPTHLGI